MKENIQVLEEVLDVLEEEKRKFYNLIRQNNFRIEEINSYLKELSKKEDEDFKVFSPRNVENIHREQIEADTSEMKKYEEENAVYNKKIEALKVLIDKVDIVISNLHVLKKREEQYDDGLLPDFETAEDTIDIEKKTGNDVSDDKGDKSTPDLDKKIKKLKDDKIEKNQTEINEVEEDGAEVDKEKKNDLEKTHIAHQILNCVSYITPDAERAKIELTALSKKLME